ncbi:MAG: NADH-quinone oxidoreductase subunit N [Bdellovibrionales bacterium]|nr:NADH-quinone oxidoreductase subunit N [Bdellovibrionales bacterium]
MDIQFELLDLLLVSPVLVLFLASIIPLTMKVLSGNRETNTFSTFACGLGGVIAATFLTAANYGIQKTAFQEALRFDGLSFWIQMTVLLVAGATLIFSKESSATNNNQFSEFVFLLLNSAIGMMVVVWANDLMTLFIGIELMSLCLYILIALSSEERLSKEAAFKYFVLGSFASAIMLYGVSFIYGTVNATTIPEITKLAPDLMETNRLFLMGVILTMLGLFFKVSIFPFHAWTPDVYQGAATPLTAFMSTGVKAVSLAFILRFFTMDILLSEHSTPLMNAVEWLAALTILVGNIAAIMQTNFKRMLAYSSVAHSGYVLIGLLAAGVGGEALLGASGVVFYVISYAIMTLGAFGVIGLFETNEDSMIDIDDLKGLAQRSPWVAACISLFMLSLAGIPPTVGFFGKFFIFSAAIKQGFVWLAIWGVIGSVISVYFYLRPIVLMYMYDEEGATVISSKVLTQMAITIAALLILALGIFSEPLYKAVLANMGSLFL